MATVKRPDILHKNVTRGRPPKSDKEKQQRQRQAYQWRDARRIYLAGSFERWRKLRSRLSLKDSSLAWHLLEAHDKGCEKCNLPNNVNSTTQKGENSAYVKEKDAAHFYPGVVVALRQLCYKHLQFQDCVELVGLICVEIDHKSKDNFSLKEVVSRATRPKPRVHELDQGMLEANQALSVLAAFEKQSLGELAVASTNVKDTITGCSDNNIEEISNRSKGLHMARDGASKNDQNSVSNHIEQSDKYSSSHETFEETNASVGKIINQECNSSKESEMSASNVSVLLSNSNADAWTSSPSLHDRIVPLCDGNDIGTIRFKSKHQPIIQSTGNKLRISLSDTDTVHVQQYSNEDLSHDSSSNDIVYESEPLSQTLPNNVLTSHSLLKTAGDVYRVDLSADSPPNTDVNDCQSLDANEEQHNYVELVERECNEDAHKCEIKAAAPQLRPLVIQTQISKFHKVTSEEISQESADLEQLMPHSNVHESCISDSASQLNATAHSQNNGNNPNTGQDMCSDSPEKDLDSIPAQESSCSDLHETLTGSSHQIIIKEEKASPHHQLDELSFKDTDDIVEDGDVPLDMSVVKSESPPQTLLSEEMTSNRLAIENRSASPALASESETFHKKAAETPDSLTPHTSSSTTVELDHASSECTLSENMSSMALLQYYTERLLHSHKQLSPDTHSLGRKRKLSETDVDTGDIADLDEKGEGNVPWPRKDMTHKVEYQFLETDPFMDFSEMSHRFPSMQQRTFYRWKRRIKDQFIFLEQRPLITFTQFNACFPQVKEHVFIHWQGLIARGHRFLANSGKNGAQGGTDTDQTPVNEITYAQFSEVTNQVTLHRERDESSDKSKEDDHTAQYIFLQKNLSLDADKFTQMFPGISKEMFYAWKKQILTDFLKLQANPQVSYQEFRKQATITQDVFSLWKSQAVLLNNGEVSAAAVTTAPTLPPVAFLAASASSSSALVGAELAAWYNSYAPLLGQVALPLWPAVSVLPTQALARPLTGDRASADREEHSGDDASSAETAGGQQTESIVGHRGRRQTIKPEHYYFLQHPDASHSALVRLFPDVSAQRYGRWRRKVAAALALLEREPDCSSQQFALYFPNVPEEILTSWRERVKQGKGLLPLGSQDTCIDVAKCPALVHCPSALGTTQQSQGSGQSATASSSDDMPNFLLENRQGSNDERSKTPNMTSTSESPGLGSLSLGSSVRKQFKVNREEFNFVQRYPNADFATFTSFFPSISIRTFYRWRRQVRDGIGLLRADPTISLSDFNKVFPEVSEEIFDVWRTMIGNETLSTASASQPGISELTSDYHSQQVSSTADQMLSDAHDAPPTSNEVQWLDAEIRNSGRTVRPEQKLVHMNPFIDYGELTQTYPGVSERSFYRWKQEAHQVMDYIRDHPDVQYKDIVVVLPHVSHEAFLKWQDIVASEKRNKSKSEEHVDHHTSHVETLPEIRTKEAVDDAVRRSHSSSVIKYNMENKSSLAASAVAETFVGEEENSGGRGRRMGVRDEFVQVMLNPSMEYAEFAKRYGTVSQRTFYRWRRNIREWRSIIRTNSDIDYPTFARMVRDVPEEAFNLWKELEITSKQTSALDISESREENNSGQHSLIMSGFPYSQGSNESHDSNVEEITVNVDDSGREDDRHHMAHQYLLRHPSLEFEALVSRFPFVLSATFQHWKKSIEMKIEYIRSIPSTNYADFHSLFPDVAEDVFQLWKALVLSEPRSKGDNFLYPSGTERQLSVSPPVHVSSQNYSLQSFSPLHSNQTSTRYKLSARHSVETDTSSHLSPLHSPAFTDRTSYPASHSERDDNLQTPVIRDVQKGGERGRREEIMHIKQESPSTPLPSFTETVSNLSRLSSMLHHHLPQHSSTHALLPPPGALLNPYTASVSASPAGIAATYTNALASIVGHNRMGESRHSVADSSPNDQSAQHYNAYPASLANISTSRDNKSGSANRVNSKETGTEKDIRKEMISVDKGEISEDESSCFSSVHSQRQRKIHRDEYMFVKQNPDVDMHEFLGRYPTVSLRTFYRWKREIREELGDIK